MHHPASEDGIHKGAEFVDGDGEGNGYLVSTVLVAENPIVVFVFGKDLSQCVGTVESHTQGATETGVADNFVVSAMEKTGGSWRSGILQFADITEDTSGIGFKFLF